MTRDLDSVPVSQASPLELLRMLWRLWRGRRENPLVHTLFASTPASMRARIGFVACAAALGIAASFFVVDALVALASLDWPAFRREFEDSALPMVAPLIALAGIAAWALARAGRRGGALLEPASLEALRTSGLSDREIVFGVAHRAMRGFLAGAATLVAVGTLCACGGLAAQALRSLTVTLDTSDVLRAFMTIVPLGVLWIATPLIVAAVTDSVLAPREPFVAAARRIFAAVALAAVVALLLGVTWLLWHFRVAREVYGYSPASVLWPLLLGDAGALAACLGAATALVAAGSLRRAMTHASSRLFAPVDPDHLRRAWWRAAAEEEGTATPPATRRGLSLGFGLALCAAGIAGPLLLSWRFAAPAESPLYYAKPRFPRIGETQEVRLFPSLGWDEVTSVTLAYYDFAAMRRVAGEERKLVRGERRGEWVLRHVPLQAGEDIGYDLMATTFYQPDAAFAVASHREAFSMFAVDIPRWKLLARGVVIPGNAVAAAILVAVGLALRLREGELPARRAQRWALRMLWPALALLVLPLCIAWLWMLWPMGTRDLVSACVHAAFACVAATLLGMAALLTTLAARRRALAAALWCAFALAAMMLSAHESVFLFGGGPIDGAARSSLDMQLALAVALVLFAALRHRALQRLHDMTASQREGTSP